MLAVCLPARTTQFVNLVSQTKDIAAYVPRDLQAMTVELVNPLKPSCTVTTRFMACRHRTQNGVEEDKQKKMDDEMEDSTPAMTIYRFFCRNSAINNNKKHELVFS